MLIAASVIFLYYTVWTLFMVSHFLCAVSYRSAPAHAGSAVTSSGHSPLQPFVDEDHPLHSLFPPRVWAIRIPVILIILFTAVVGTFLSVVMIRSNRKKALKAKAKKGS